MMARADATRLFVPLIGANVIVWAAAFAVFRGNAVLLGTALLAYGIGLRHAVDADHIAAIDNVTRKLIHAGQRPLLTGLYFSLGHSAVVWLASLGVAFAATAASPRMTFVRGIGGTLGTSISVLFLFAIAAANIFVLRGLVRAIRRHNRGETPEQVEVGSLFAPQGVYVRFFRPLFHMVSTSRHMFFIGLLFGLGFDTATEIGVLGISAAAAGQGLPVWSILMFPALFTAGMSLVDTLDSTLMTHAYGWAFIAPARKLYYNFTVTFFSVLVALVVGSIEALSLVPGGAGLPAPAHSLVASLTAGIGRFGYTIVIGFAGLWLLSAILERHKRTFTRAMGTRVRQALSRAERTLSDWGWVERRGTGHQVAALCTVLTTSPSSETACRR